MAAEEFGFHTQVPEGMGFLFFHNLHLLFSLFSLIYTISYLASESDFPYCLPP
jgi:hypothetical protein